MRCLPLFDHSSGVTFGNLLPATKLPVQAAGQPRCPGFGEQVHRKPAWLPLYYISVPLRLTSRAHLHAQVREWLQDADSQVFGGKQQGEQNAFLAQTTALIQQASDELFGEKGPGEARGLMTKLPAHAFCDFEQDGALCVLLQSAFAYRRSQGGGDEWFLEQLSDKETAAQHTALFLGIEKALLNAGLILRFKVFFSDAIPRADAKRLEDVAKAHNAAIVPRASEATHEILPEPADAPGGARPVRSLARQAGLVKVHHPLWPESYDEWVPQYQAPHGVLEPRLPVCPNAPHARAAARPVLRPTRGADAGAARVGAAAVEGHGALHPGSRALQRVGGRGGLPPQRGRGARRRGGSQAPARRAGRGGARAQSRTGGRGGRGLCAGARQPGELCGKAPRVGQGRGGALGGPGRGPERAGAPALSRAAPVVLPMVQVPPDPRAGKAPRPLRPAPLACGALWAP